MTNRRRSLKKRESSRSSNEDHKRIKLEERLDQADVNNNSQEDANLALDEASDSQAHTDDEVKVTEKAGTGECKSLQDDVNIPAAASATTHADLENTGLCQCNEPDGKADTSPENAGLYQSIRPDGKADTSPENAGLSQSNEPDRKADTSPENIGLSQPNEPDNKANRSQGGTNKHNIEPGTNEGKTESTGETDQMLENNHKHDYVDEEMKKVNSSEIDKTIGEIPETTEINPAPSTDNCRRDSVSDAAFGRENTDLDVEDSCLPKSSLEGEVKENVGCEKAEAHEETKLEQGDLTQQSAKGDKVKETSAEIDPVNTGLVCPSSSDRASVADDITDSQLCAMDWSSQFPTDNTPSAHEQTTASRPGVSVTGTGSQDAWIEDGTAVIVTLIKELQQFNKSLLKTKREIEEARRQRHH